MQRSLPFSHSGWFRRLTARFGRARKHAETPLDPGRAIAAAIAKWLIPSVSALFVVTGYVVVSAHNHLLGIAHEGYGASDYIAATASFLQDLLTLLPDAALNMVTGTALPHFDVHQLGLIVALLLVCTGLAIAGTGPFHSEGGSLGQWALAVLVVALLFWTFIVMDAPLTHLENVLVSVGRGGGEVTGEVPIEKNLDNLAQRKGLESFIATRATVLWEQMACKRVRRDALLARGRRVECGEIDGAIDPALRNEFLAHSLISLLLVTLSLQAVRRAKSSILAIVSLLGLCYVLTWPYAYGKLVKPTFYDYGLVLFKSPMTEPGTPPKSEVQAINGIVLYRNEQTTELLYAKRGNCPEGQGATQEVKLWEVSNSEVKVIQEIYREDVITWAIQNDQPCPSVEFE